MNEDIRFGKRSAVATGRRPAPDHLAPKPILSRPALVVVDDDHPAISTLAGALRRRYGADYDVRAFPEPDTAFAELERMRDADRDVALIVASQWMTSETGAAFLARTQDVYPSARRLLTSAWGDLSAMQPVARASTLGEIDYHATRPWNETDEQFLATVGDILAEWAREQGRYGPAITIVAHQWDAEAQSLADIFQRWGSGPGFIDAASPQGRRLLAEHPVEGQLPLVVLPDGRALTQPTLAEVTETIGANAEPLSTPFDLVALGSGPAGLSAALNAAAEGLRVLLVEPGIGQASASPMIRNYLGFPAGVSGAELVRRAWQQAWMFGVHGRMGRAARGIRADGDERIVTLDDGSEVRTGAIVLATGVEHRRLGIPSVDRLVGRGVFYGSGATEAPAIAGERVVVVGGGNSAAQAALHLARYARSVSLVVRDGSLAGSVSDYLLEQLGARRNVEVRLNTQVVEARDAQRLRSLVLRDSSDGTVEELKATALFTLIGSVPRTEWLPTDIARDEQGFVLTGEEAPPADEPGTVRLWLETTMPGVFAVGDVRHGSIKRVAVAVGDGAMASQQVQRYRSGLAARAGDLDEPTESGRLAGTAAAQASHEQVTR